MQYSEPETFCSVSPFSLAAAGSLEHPIDVQTIAAPMWEGLMLQCDKPPEGKALSICVRLFFTDQRASVCAALSSPLLLKMVVVKEECQVVFSDKHTKKEVQM